MSPIWAMTVRDFRIAASYRTAFWLDLILGMLNVLVYYFISKTLGDAPTGALGSAPDYFSFAAVGAIITVVVQAASTGVTRRIREEQLTGTLEAMSVEPVTPGQISLGGAAFPFLFAAVRALLYLLIAGLFLELDLSQADWPGVLIMLTLAGISLSVVGIVVGGLVLIINRGEALAPLITLGLALLGGSVFPIETLPPFFEAIGEIMPTRYIFDGARDALFAGGGWVGDALALLPWCLVGIPTAIWMFASALHFARAKGTLGQY